MDACLQVTAVTGICYSRATALVSRRMQADQNICHRCSGVFPEESLYCPHCGAPQLVLSEADAERFAAERAVTPGAPTGPLPRIPGTARIRWRPLLRVVAILALAAAIMLGAGGMLPGLGLLGLFIVFSSPLFTINFYQRLVPGAPMSATIGVRIGLALGVLMSFVLAAVDAIREVIYRYVLHHGATMDQAITAALQKMKDSMASYPTATPSSTEGVRQILRFFSTPDGHAAMALMSGAMMSAGILVYCLLSGMVLGWLRPMPPRRNII